MTASKVSSTHHFNVAQLRIDLWNQLRTQLHFRQKEKRKDVDSENNKSVSELLNDLAIIEQYYSFPGKKRIRKLQEFVKNEEFYTASIKVNELVRQLVSESYRSNPGLIKDEPKEENSGSENGEQKTSGGNKNHFEVLFVDNLSRQEETAMRSKIAELSEDDEHLYYDVLVQHSFQDALIALLLNYNIQAVVIRYAPPYASENIDSLLNPFLGYIHDLDFSDFSVEDLGPILGKIIKQFRPELDIYYVTDTALLQLKDSTVKNFRRIFYRKDDIQELHLAILRGIRERYKTPFFTALKEYSQKPVGVFHAMPISRGNSVFKSRWIRDFGHFYGRNLCLAETSSTTGGLDSLLQPTGSLKEAQKMASNAYGSKRTFFVTNGTSTSNKIVQQALVEPGDLVLIDRDCHKSHHYGLVLAGALPVYLDSYPIEKYSMYGAVPLEEIKHTLLELKKAGRLDKVKMLLLTNCTFDGLVYNVERVMEEILAIKPDIIFLWDEA